MIKYEIIEIQGKLFQVKRKFPEDRINLKKGRVSDLKQFFHCDTIFKELKSISLSSKFI